MDKEKLIARNRALEKASIIVLLVSLAVTILIGLPLALFNSIKWAYVFQFDIVCLVSCFVLRIVRFFITPREIRKELKAEDKAMEKQREEYAVADATPVAAKLLDIEVVTGSSKSSAAARGLVGGAIFGVVGAAYGMATAKQEIKEKNAYFLVEYGSGRIDTEIVSVGSARFNQLIALAKEE